MFCYSFTLLLASRPVNEPNEHEHKHVRVRSFNFNRTRTYNRTYFFVRVRSLRNRTYSCSFMFVHFKAKRTVHEHKRTKMKINEHK
ncbi:hypothetical protein HanRHA438_Chr07g0319141 [Helianthus annuus]|nr:hypothetical protein HanIR_Chr07g0334891 [Helianthus annuus]KAJ0909217.1 hypothetical protein HanRHA438_Chr07g0319141 [Helianthus annuus]